MHKKTVFYILLLFALLLALSILWILPKVWEILRIRIDNPIGDEWQTPNIKQVITQASDTPVVELPHNVVQDPESGQYVLYNELTILASGEDVRVIVEEFKGEIVSHVKETDTYQVRFPIRDLTELKQIAVALENKGLTVYLSVVLIP